MKKHIMIFGSAAIALAFSGCGSQSTQQGKNLSSSGIAYTEAVDSLLDVTVDRVIDFDSQDLIKIRKRSPETTLEDAVNERNRLVKQHLLEIEEFRGHTKLLKSYFLNLQALADSSVKADTGSAVESLSSSIGKLNKKLDKKLTANRRKQIGNLAGIVAKQVHSVKIERALKRDARIIGKSLLLQEQQLENIAEILKSYSEAENDAFAANKVISPYINKAEKLDGAWAGNRKKWLKAQFMNKQLDTARIAAKQLRGVWEDILQGKNDINALSLLISDVNEFVTVAQNLKESSKKKPSN